MSFWRLIPWLLALVVALPFITLFSSLFETDSEIWKHLWQTTLPLALGNTLLLLLLVSLGTLGLGISTAWLIARYDFPGRKFFSRLVILPLAIPGYVYAFVFIGIFDYTSFFQGLLRPLGLGFEFRNVLGLAFVMSLSLFPYVYLLTKNAFETHGMRLVEAAQSLGHDSRSSFFRVLLPMARPWVLGGLSLVLMETLADFGTVATFNYETFTTAIYKSWYALFSWSTGAKLSLTLVFLVFWVLLLENRARQKKRFHQSGEKTMLRKPKKPILITSFFSFLIFTALVLPLSQLVIWGLEDLAPVANFLGLLKNTFLLALAAALIVGLLAFFLSYSRRLFSNGPVEVLTRFSTLGYAVPGTVLAVGLIGFLGKFNLFGSVVWSIAALLLAYSVRFLALGFQTMDSGFQRIHRELDDVATSLGSSDGEKLRRIHIPLLKPVLWSSALLIFVETAKEMPITLLIRPFGWDTLSVRLFELTSEGEWQKAALPALALVMVSLLPAFLLAKTSEDAT